MLQGINSAFACSESTKSPPSKYLVYQDGFSTIKVKTITISAVSQIQMTFGLQCAEGLEA
jgi:hypothetical protein